MSRKMAIDTIRKRVGNRINLVLTYLMISVNIALSQTTECQVHSVVFDVLSKDYLQFSTTIDSYYTSEYSYDLLILKIKGGNSLKSYVLRYYLDDDWYSYSRSGDGSGETSRVFPDSVLVDQLTNLRKIGDYIEVCPLSSSNDTYIYMIKRDGEVYVKYQSRYPVSPQRKDVDCLKGFVDKLARLKN